jgi:L-serine dehydratase
MEVSRKEKGKEALMVIEIDQNADEVIINELNSLPIVQQVVKIHD